MQLYPGRHGSVHAKQVSGSYLGERSDIPGPGISQHRKYLPAAEDRGSMKEVQRASLTSNRPRDERREK